VGHVVDEGTLVMELSNGLTPIDIQDEESTPDPTPDPTPEPVAEDEEDDTRFTREELEVMAAPAVKRYGKRIECEATTKSGIIAELFDKGEDSFGAFDADVSSPPADPTVAGVAKGGQLGDTARDSDIKDITDSIDKFLTRLANGEYGN